MVSKLEVVAGGETSGRSSLSRKEGSVGESERERKEEMKCYADLEVALKGVFKAGTHPM